MRRGICLKPIFGLWQLTSAFCSNAMKLLTQHLIITFA